MPATLEGQLVVAISSRALFDFEEENRLFEKGNDAAYVQRMYEEVEQRIQAGMDRLAAKRRFPVFG